jgi:hypothetical protein
MIDCKYSLAQQACEKGSGICDQQTLTPRPAVSPLLGYVSVAGRSSGNDKMIVKDLRFAISPSIESIHSGADKVPECF